MKKSLRLSSIYLGVLAASLLTSSVALAGSYKGEHHNYKGEQVVCPSCTMIRDGFYIGVQGGYDSYRVRETIGAYTLSPVTTTLGGLLTVTGVGGITADPVLNAVGGVGGLFLGYGQYFQDFYYLGGEIWANGSGARTNYSVNGAVAAFIPGTTLTSPLNFAQYTTDVKAQWSWGVSLMPGIKLNCSTLGYIRLGYARHKLRTNETASLFLSPVPATGATIGTVFPGSVASFSTTDTDWYSGFAYGLGMESTFAPNWSVRGDYTHTNLGARNNTFTNTRFSASDNQYMLSLIYHFDWNNVWA